MKCFLSILLFFTLHLQAKSIDELVDTALKQNLSLEIISHRIMASKEKTSSAGLFSNPELSYTQNTLDNNQAMSRKTLAFKQKLPYFGKRDSLEKISLAHENVLSMQLEKAKLVLVRKIKQKAYETWALERLYTIICDYEALTRHNIELFESYTSTANNQHMGIMSAELTLSELRIQKSSLNAKINAAYAELSYLSAVEVHSLEINPELSEMPGLMSLKKGLENNPDLSLNEEIVQREGVKLEHAALNNYPDLSLMSAYSKRENFDDYWSFTVGMSLPIYGKEDYQEEEARKLLLASQSQKQDIALQNEAQLETVYSQMKSAYETYHIIHDQALPQIEHMFVLMSASISTGADLFKYIDILVQKLKLEQKSILAIAQYKSAQAKISELSGEIK